MILKVIVSVKRFIAINDKIELAEQLDEPRSKARTDHDVITVYHVIKVA
jgi:hypothetical protein